MLDNAVLLCVPRKTFMCILKLLKLNCIISVSQKGWQTLGNARRSEKNELTTDLLIIQLPAWHQILCLEHLMALWFTPYSTSSRTSIITVVPQRKSITVLMVCYGSFVHWFTSRSVRTAMCHIWLLVFWFWHITISLFDRWTLLKPWQYSEKWKAVH